MYYAACLEHRTTKWDKPIPEDQLAGFQQNSRFINYLDSCIITEVSPKIMNFMFCPMRPRKHSPQLTTCVQLTTAIMLASLSPNETTHSLELRSSNIMKLPCYLHQRKTRLPHSSDLHQDQQYNRFTLDQRF